MQRGMGRGRPGAPKIRRCHDAWNAASDFIEKCMADPNAVRFMDKKNIRKQVREAIFDIGKVDRNHLAQHDKVGADERLDLSNQLATLTSIFHPKDFEEMKHLVMRQDLPDEEVPPTIYNSEPEESDHSYQVPLHLPGQHHQLHHHLHHQWHYQWHHSKPGQILYFRLGLALLTQSLLLDILEHTILPNYS